MMRPEDKWGSRAQQEKRRCCGCTLGCTKRQRKRYKGLKEFSSGIESNWEVLKQDGQQL